MLATRFRVFAEQIDNQFHHAKKNRNKILPQFLPKKTNFDLISQDTLDNIQRSVNDSLLKLLGWNIPSSASLFV